MKKKIQTIVFLIFICHTLKAQSDSFIIEGLPFNSLLIQVDSLSDLEFEYNKFVWREFVRTFDSNKYWEFVGLIIESSADGGIPDEMKTPQTYQYKLRNDYQIIHSGKSLIELFDINESRRPPGNSVFGTSYHWIPSYHGQYLIIEKCDGYIGGQTSYEKVFKYYFKEHKPSNYQLGINITDTLFQNEIVTQINNKVKLIENERFDTLVLKDIHLSFDTLHVVNSPIPKHTFNDSTSVYVLYNENGIRKLIFGRTFYYFDDEKLIKTHFRCASGDFMGLCGGTYSEYENYFGSDKYYTTIKNNTFRDIYNDGGCPCGDNIIINLSSIEKIILMLNEQK